MKNENQAWEAEMWILAYSWGKRGLTLFFVAILTMTSCTPIRTVTTTKTSDTITKYIRKDTVIQGATVRDTITFERWNTMQVNNVRIIRDTTGRTELRVYKDAYGRLQLQCESKDQLFTWFEKFTRIRQTEVTDRKLIYGKNAFLWGLIIGLIGFMLLRTLFGLAMKNIPFLLNLKR